MIAIIWAASFLISSPPLFGWNDWKTMKSTACEYTQEKGYIIYSSFGSFVSFIAKVNLTIVKAAAHICI